MHRKMLSYFVALAVATGAFLAHAEMVGEDVARAVAEGFLAKSSVAKTILAGRSVDAVEAYGSLWIAHLAPSGYIEVAGSTKCAPIAFFSTQDFVEPEVGSPFAAKLTGDSLMVAEKEADESAADNADWAKYTAPVAKKRALLKAAPSGTTGVVGPLMNCGWGQGAPFNDLSPLSSLCGCMATAAGQEHRYWRWPYRYEKSRQGAHGLRNSLGEYSEHVMRPDGRVPFNYDKVVAYAPSPASTPWATDKEATYQTAFLSLWMQSLTGMSYKPGASGGTQKLCNYAEDYWFERGPVMSYWRDGYTNLWNAIKADLDFGSPIQVNSPGHQMVVDGYAFENEGTDSEVHYININYGWGSPEGWVNLLTAVTESTSGGRLADFQTGYRPQKIVQFEPVPKVSASSVTLKWHLPPCYTNRTMGFKVEIAKNGGEPTIDTVTTHDETTTYTATDLENGCSYAFTVTPLMSDSSEARSNTATTTIGTPAAAPTIDAVSSKACGIDLVQQGFYIECGRGVTNTIDVTCSTSVTSLKTYSSHLTVLPDNKVSTADNGNGSWTINVDATTMAKDWDGDMLILTLVAANDDGTEAYKNLMLRFNSMRNVLGGTFDIVDTSANSSVWFAAGTTTTLDAKGQSVAFGPNAFNGAGTVVLADSVGNGSFTFQGLNGFTGTLKWAPSMSVTLPADMSGFAGTLWFESYRGEYNLSGCTLPSSAKVYIANATTLNLVDSTINAAVSGNGAILIPYGTSSFGNLKDFTGEVAVGTQDTSATLTLRAGEEKNTQIWNGTLNLRLSREQVAYGYATSQVTHLEAWTGSRLIFQDENGQQLEQWTSMQTTYSISSRANTWTPDGNGAGNFLDAARWSQGLPSEGDYVIFNDTVGDSEMTINLSSDFNLGYVKVIGDNNFQIKAADGTAVLSVDTLENTVQTKIKTAKFLPTAVIPQAKLFVASGITLDCEIDQSIANNIRDPYDLEGLYWENCWHGTVVFTDYSDSAMPGLDLTFWGNANSTVRLNGFTGRLTANKTIPYTVELVDNGTSPALHWSTGTGGATSTFEVLTGDGIFKTSGGTAEKVLLKDVSGFTGQFQLAAKTVAIASEMPTTNIGSDGKLHVCKDATIAPGSIWNIGGGVYFGSGCNLDVYGQLWSLSAAMTTYGEGAVVTLEEGAVIRMALAMAGDYAPELNFKAGTYQFDGNVTETKTVNFCADEGKYTTLDANGNRVTLGANFFSGSGDVYLKTSVSGGAFVIQGVSAAYTGTIYVDNSIGLTISGDLSQMGGKINISDITLSRNSSNIGKIDVCSGATLQVVLTDDEAMEGLTVTGVTLNGGTIEFVDQRGTLVGSSTESLVYVKPEDYTVPSPEATAIWYGDFSSDACTQFSGYAIDDWNETHGENYSSVTIDRNNQGLLVDFASAKGYFTVIVKYSDLAASSSYKRVLFATTGNSDYTRDRCGIRLLTDSKVQGLWNASLSDNSDADYGSASTDTVPSAGTLAFVYDKSSSGGVSAYVAANDDFLPTTALWNNTALKGGDMYGFAVGGMCRDAAVSGVEAAKGMTITGLAIFDKVLTASELKYFRWPEDEPGDDPEPKVPTFEVSPASGAVAAGTKMTVTCSDPTATIWYKKFVTGDEEYVEYTEPVALTTGINYYYVKVNDGEATMYTYIVAAPEPEYEGPAPIAVWVAGEFGDDRSAHGGLEFALNGNATNELGQIVIGDSTTLGATVAVPSGTLPKMTMLVKYSVPAGGAPVAQSVPASLFSTYDLGALAGAGSSALAGYWLNGSTVSTGSYAFSDPAQTMPQEGYILVSNWTKTPNASGHGTAVYSGETLSALVGGEVTGLRFTGDNNYITAIGVGGPTIAGTKPWAGMVIKSVALFDDWVVTNVIANYKFPAQGAVKPEDSDRYVVEPVASWVNDFKTTEKNGCTLSVSGTTAVKDDAFGGVLTVGDSAVVIDTASADALTVLVKYRSAPAIQSAPVVTFGGQAAVTFDSGICTDTSVDRQLAAYYSFFYNNARQRAINAVDGNPTLSSDGGYVVCARKYNACHAYVGDSLDNMTGGECTTGMQISNSTLRKIGIGGQTELSNNDANMVPFTGFVVEKVVVFNGYYTPDEIRYIPNPEDGDTVNIADNTTWTFTASDAPREYTSVGTLSSSGTIAIANASELVEGTYPLATWTTPQQYTTQCAGYGKVGTLVTDGLASGLSARLIYGARAIYLRVDDTAKQAARKPLVVWCYGDSITEGFNAQATGANYRILLYQKLEMLGYNVKSTGVYGLSNNHDSVDPSGTALTDQYKWHSAKHGATAGPSTLCHRSNLSENVDTLAIQAGTPDVALLLIGVNDFPEFSTVEPVFKSWTNVVNRLVNNLPDTKIIVSTILYSDGTRTDIDPKITNINNNYIKPLIADMPEAWKGHVVLADLNSIVKSGDPGIIYSDHLHPDWWGYDQMADGYLEKIVECYPNPDATDFPSQNPIPDAPTADQLGAANKPGLADYRAGFTKLCNIRVEKGQDVNNVVYDNVNSAAASNNLEKVGYFVEFVRDDNHAHKWVWVDMDAFGDKDLASVGLPQRIYQQAVTKMHVCSNHGAIDNVAADDDSVTGWIEFSPYNYSYDFDYSSEIAAPTNYFKSGKHPYDWADTLQNSGSYGCMQVFRVKNPASVDLYERPQVLFAFNNFQSQNSNPADFGIGNFAQHFNCDNNHHSADWTGVGGTLAKMAPDAYSVKTIEIWTKEAYTGPAPVAVWVAGEFDDDRSAHGGCEFALNGNTTNALGQIVIGSATTLGATITTPGYDNATVLVEYEIPSGGAPAANSVPASVFVTKEMGALAGSGSSDIGGYWLNGSTVTTGYAFSSPAPSIPQKGYLLISTPANSDNNPGNHYVAAYVGETVSALSGGETSGLRFTGAANRVTSVGVGGPTVAGAVPWTGMVIKNVAIFDAWLTPDDLKGYKFPEQGAVRPVDTDEYLIEPVVSWVNDFKTTTKGDYTLSVSGTTAAKDDTFGGTLTIGDAAAVIDATSAEAITVLVKYRAAADIHSAPVVTFGGQAAVTFDSGICTATSVDRQLSAYYSFIYNNARQRAINAVDGNPTLSSDGGYVVCARKYNACHAYVGDSLDNMTGGECTEGMQISNSTLKKIGIGGQTELSSNDENMVPFTGFVVEKVVVFNGYYTPDQIRYVENPEDGDTINIAAGATWNFAAGETRTYTNIGSLNEGGTIAVTNAASLAEGVYTLATWTTAQKKSTGYGHVALSVDGIPDGLSAELVYGARAIYLRVWNQTTQAARGTIKVWPYGDSITEGFNAGGTRANYRVLLAQKLSMLGFNVEMVGCYDKINGAEVIDPAGQVVPDAWKWHSAKHGATAGPTTSAAGRANLCENVDTLCAQAGNPDVVLLLAGANDIVPATGLSAQQVVSSVTNIVAHIATNLPNTKIVVGNQINVEQGYNSGNYNHVTNMIPQVNALLKNYVDNLPEGLNGKVFLADLNSYVKSGEYGILFDHGSDHLHPDWWGHDQMAEGWLSVVTNQFTSTQTFPSATVPAAPTSEELGAAAKSELAEYRSGYKLCRTIDVASTNAPSVVTGDGATENIEKVGYFVEYVRADNNAHKWVWVDMDAFGTTIGDVGLPTNNHQQVVTKLHVKSNHNGIDDVAANDDSVSGFVEFSPFDYNGNVSGVSGAPAGNASCCDWNDTLSTSGSYGCMQVHRVFSPAKSAADGVTRGGQVLFAYNNWQSSSSAAEFGIGNFSSHFYRGANDAQTFDYTYTANASKMNASAYSVKRIEIWTKTAEPEEPEEKYTNTDYPVPYSWFGEYNVPENFVTTVMNSEATGKKYKWWECYVLGLDPTNADSQFVVTIRMDGTKPVVEYSPTNNLDDITYVLQGKPALTNDWFVCPSFDEPGDTNRFFRVKVTW